MHSHAHLPQRSYVVPQSVQLLKKGKTTWVGQENDHVLQRRTVLLPCLLACPKQIHASKDQAFILWDRNLLQNAMLRVLANQCLLQFGVYSLHPSFPESCDVQDVLTWPFQEMLRLRRDNKRASLERHILLPLTSWLGWKVEFQTPGGHYFYPSLIYTHPVLRVPLLPPLFLCSSEKPKIYRSLLRNTCCPRGPCQLSAFLQLIRRLCSITSQPLQPSFSRGGLNS